jgi:hypothetical protein
MAHATVLPTHQNTLTTYRMCVRRGEHHAGKQITKPRSACKEDNYIVYNSKSVLLGSVNVLYRALILLKCFAPHTYRVLLPHVPHVQGSAPICPTCTGFCYHMSHMYRVLLPHVPHVQGSAPTCPTCTGFCSHMSHMYRVLLPHVPHVQGSACWGLKQQHILANSRGTLAS